MEHSGFKIVCGLYMATSLWFKAVELRQRNDSLVLKIQQKELLHSFSKIYKGIKSKQKEDTRENI